VIISVVLLPHYFHGDLYTAYQLIERRFGQRLRSLTAGLFLITRAAAEGVRVFAVAIVVAIALGPLLGSRGEFQRDVISIGIVTLLTLLYTFEGGMAAVIWTDVIQTFIYLGGTLVGFFTILHLVPGGWTVIHATVASAGILIAAILAAAMSNLSAALNSLSSTSIIDFYLRHRPETPEHRRVLLSRVATIAWGAVLFGLAILSRRGGKVVEVGLSIASVAYGALLGVFLLGVLTRRANQRGSMVGMAFGFCANAFIWQGSTFLTWLERISGLPFTAVALSRPIPFPWYVLIGSVITFAIGYSSSLLLSSHDDSVHATSD